uniref:Uncharacterized protein n=1 Tax=Anguilla anguilla TaxID=7936 RepID=A0A0E9VMI8_ANGAN
MFLPVYGRSLFTDLQIVHCSWK